MNDMKKTTKRFTHILKKATTILAVFVVFLSTYAMTLPALTLDEETADTEAGIVLEENNNTEEEISDELSFEQSEENNEAVIEISENEENIEEIHEEEKTIESFGPFFFYDDSTDVIVSVEAPEGAFEENTVMIVTPVREEEVIDTVNSTLENDESNNRATKIQAVDISFYYNDEEVEPLLPIKVSLTSKLIKESNKDPKIIHIDDKGEGEIIEQSSDVESKEDEVIFEAESFSTYVLVITTDYITDEGDTYKITVTYDEEAGIPEGAYLDVEEITGERFNELYDQTTDLLDAEFFSYARIFDITIYDDESNHVDPSSNVEVSIELLDEVDENDNFTVVHFAPEATKINSRSEGNSVSFETDGFSAYAIVQGPGAVQPGWIRISTLADLKEKAAEGMYIGTTGNYYLRNNTTAHSNGGSTIAGLSGIQRSTSTRAYPTDDAALYYFEEVEGQTNQFYIYCYDANNNKLYATYDTEATAVPYSIILTADETKKTPCTVSVTGSGATAYWRIRFNNNANLRWYLRNNIFDAQNSDTNYYFYQNLGTDVDTYGLDGKTYGLMYWIEGIMGKGLMSDANKTAGHLDALALTVMSKPNNGSKLYVPDNSDLSFWTFHFIDTDNYYLTTVVDGSTKYLRLGSDGVTLVSVPDNNCKIRVVPGTGSNAGKIYLRSGNYTLAYSGNIDEGFKIGGKAGNEWLNLVELSELTPDYFMTYSAEKVSVSDSHITNGSRIIVYTRVWNDTTKKYEFYAVGHDGSLVRCYESGDSIEWVSGRLNSMLWNFVEYYWEGTTNPNYYYELYNQYSEKYIAPQKSDGQILSDNTIGINMNGRRDGKYYTPIVAWDDDYYAYAGLKANTQTGKIESCPMSEADDFYFAIMEDIPVDDKLTTVPTVDHTQYGITMKMVNFGTDIYPGNNDTNVRAAMTSFLGSNNTFQQWSTEAGLLNTAVGADGYPVTKAGNSLSEWFANAQEVNHLFIQSTYSGTGYFEFDSVQNFAHLDPNKNEFVVYKQLGSDSVTSATHQHGLFWPYNDIVAGVFSVNKNNLTINSQPLPETDPRKYESLYQIQKANTNFAPDYYFGMEVTASFTQTPNGLDDWGHDIIYEFTGDDDFWLFVDDELILDLGGIHSAIPGSVNYRTGVVNVNGTSTTLRALFESNYRKRYEGATDEEVETYLDEIFDEEIFKPYTNHTMKIYYLERGAGSSNLHMRFNLASIKPGTVQLSKKLSGVDPKEFITAEFPYQIWYHTADGSDHLLTNMIPQVPVHNTNYVFYKDTINPAKFQKSITIDGVEYNYVFIIKPGETVDINFPEDVVDYRIVECGVNTEVYKLVSVNGSAITGEPVEGTENREDFGINYATPEDRARVTYDNKVNPDALRTLTFAKRIYKEDGTTEITDDKTEFSFRMYMSTEFKDLELASMHTYHVKDENGNYCRWDVDLQKFVSLGEDKKDFTKLTDDEKTQASFTTSLNGAISKIQRGYTVEIRNVLAGTKYRIEERPTEVPDGYTFQQYLIYSDVKDQSPSAAYTNPSEKYKEIVVANKDPHVEIRNLKGFGLRVNKIFTDADYMVDRGPTYFAVFVQSAEKMTMVDNTLRQMPYGTSTLYWFWLMLPVSDTTLDQYVAREVTIDGTYTVDTNGYVTLGKGASIVIKKDGDTVQLNGRQKSESQDASFTYTVSNTDAREDNVRISTVTNKRPGITIKKSDWSWNNTLAGATFSLSVDGQTIGTFTSAEDGIITEAFLSEGKMYTLTETKAPATYHGMQGNLQFRLFNGKLEFSEESEYYRVSEDNTIITVRNRPYSLRAIKLDADTQAALPGVKFALHKWHIVDGVEMFDPIPMDGYRELTTDADGIIPKIDKTLGPGTYQLREVETLANYKLLDKYIEFKISETGDIFFINESALPKGTTLESEAKDDGTLEYTLKIKNYQEKKVSFKKVDVSDTSKALKDAEFDLYEINDQDVPMTEPMEHLTSGDDGMMANDKGTKEFALPVGNYQLVETKAPAGYNMKSEPVIIHVTNNGVTYNEGTSLSSSNYGVTATNGVYTLLITNTAGVELPHTGGIGTTIFRMAGLTLILTAGIVLILKKH